MIQTKSNTARSEKRVHAKSNSTFVCHPYPSLRGFETIRSIGHSVPDGATMAMGFGVVADGVALGDGAPGCLVLAEICAYAFACAENFGEARGERTPWAVGVGQPCRDEADAPGSGGEGHGCRRLQYSSAHLAPSHGLD